MTQNEIFRKKLFDIFSKNLNFIKKTSSNILTSEAENYICPICLQSFCRQSLTQDEANPLTLEDVPPSRLGGHPLVLTCKQCNNVSGSLLDRNLVDKIKAKELFQKIPGSLINVKIKLDKDINITGTMSHRKDGGVSFHLYKDGPLAKDKKKAAIEKVKKYLSKGKLKKFEVNANLYKLNHSRTAILRIGYLIAFSFFGYGFLENQNLEPIRRQILCPTKEMLPEWGIIENESKDLPLGVSLITKPEGLRSFLIVFALKTKISSSHYGVILPGFTSPGLDVYKHPATSFTAIQVPPKNYLGECDLMHASSILWNELTEPH